MITIEAFKPPRAERKSCLLTRILQSMTKNDAEIARTAINDPDVGSGLIARVLTENGFRISEETIRRHRRSGCGCEAAK